MTININIGEISPLNIVSAMYEPVLNGIGQFEVKIDGAGSLLRAEADPANENEIKFYRNGTLEFSGYADDVKEMDGGGVIIIGRGIEREFTDIKCPVDAGKETKTYLSTNDNTIFTNLMSGTGWNLDVTDSTTTNIDAFRVNSSMSRWNGLIALIKQVNKDLVVDYSTKTLALVDQAGTTSAFSFETGKNAANFTNHRERARASKVIVYGKGDGSNQIVGEAGSGTPVKEIIDRNIISTTAANQRATSELALISAATKRYSFQVTTPNLELSLGDEGSLTATGTSVSGESIAVVRYKREIDTTGSERLSIHVTNTGYRVATGNLEEMRAQTIAEQIKAESSMQGSGNLLTWGSGINAKLNAPLRIGFYVSSQFEDEVGNLRIQDLELDYDIDPYRNGVGDASFTGSDPQVQNISGDDSPSVTGSSADSSVDADWDISYGVDTNGGSTGDTVTGPFVSGQGDINLVVVHLVANRDMPQASSQAGYDIIVSIDGTAIFSEGPFCTYGPSATISFLWPGDYEGDDFDLSIIDNGNGGEGYSWNFSVSTIGQHSHGDGSYAAIDHGHPDGSYDINATDLDFITIGDDVNDAGSLNATAITWYLDYFDSGSWVNKAFDTVSSTQGTEIDLTSGGTYPDATGYWRVRVDPNSTAPDYVQGIVRLKHALDN